MKFRTLALAILTFAVLLPWSNSAFAGDDPSITGELRANIQQAILRAIDEGTVGGIYRFYDPLTQSVLSLEFTKLYSETLKKGDFYVRCAEFKDSRGRVVDVDFLVIPDGDEMRVTLAALHKLGAEKKRASTLMPVLVLWVMVGPQRWAALARYPEAILCQWRAEKLRDDGHVATCLPRVVRQLGPLMH